MAQRAALRKDFEASEGAPPPPPPPPPRARARALKIWYVPQYGGRRG